MREVEEETGLGPDEIEAFYDLDQVAPFYDEGTDAVVVSAIFAARVRPDAEPASLVGARRPALGPGRGGAAARDLAVVRGVRAAGPRAAAGPGRWSRGSASTPTAGGSRGGPLAER